MGHKLEDLVGKISIFSDYIIGKDTNVNSNSICSYLVEPHSTSELINVLDTLEENSIPYHMLGGGFNTLFRDKYEGVVISTKKLNMCSLNTDFLLCEPGYMLPEFIKGVPGTAAGKISSNAGIEVDGKYEEIGDRVIGVAVYNHGEIEVYDRAMCEFGYRDSIFRNSDLVILGCFFDMSESLTKNPVSYPENNLGSIFKNPEGFKAWELIRDAGVSKEKIEGVGIYFNHYNILDVDDNVSGTQIYSRLEDIRAKVKAHSGIDLEYEIIVK